MAERVEARAFLVLDLEQFQDMGLVAQLGHDIDDVVGSAALAEREDMAITRRRLTADSASA